MNIFKSWPKTELTYAIDLRIIYSCSATYKYVIKLNYSCLLVNVLRMKYGEETAI